MRLRLIVALPILVVALALGYYFLAGHQTPPDQPPLADMNPQTLESLKARFNAGWDRTRIIVLLSPT